MVAAWVGYGAPVHSEEVFFTKIIGDVSFAVPKQYLHPRPIADRGGKCLSCAFGIQFWIPDLSAPEKGLWFKPEYRPPESARPSPTLEEFVVKVTSIEYVRQPSNPGIDTAENRIQATLNMYDADKWTYEKFGALTGILDERSHNRPRKFYISKSEGSVFIFCAGNRIRKTCIGYADIPKHEITSSFLFPGSEIQNFELIVDGISKLLDRWKIG